jgi:branched-chain amino acid aminotransferase
MNEAQYIWMNGEIIDWKDATTHVLNHGLHYGSSVFEGIRAYETVDGKVVIFRLKEHIERLFYSADALKMKIPYSRQEIENAIIQTVKENDLKSGYIRPIAFYGYGTMGLDPRKAKVDICVAAWPWGSYLGDDLIKVKTSSYIRIHPQSSETKAKIGGHYVNSIMANIEAHDAGFDEGLFLDYEGNVAEGPGENIFMVKDGTLYTPKEGNILMGITRSAICAIAKEHFIDVIEKTIHLDELKNADEVFFTGTAAEIAGIKQIDESIIADGELGPITTQLKSMFMETIHGKRKEYKHWLTYV